MAVPAAAAAPRDVLSPWSACTSIPSNLPRCTSGSALCRAALTTFLASHLRSLSILLLPKAARASLSANLTISGHCSEAIPDSHHFPSKFPALTGAWRSFETCPGSRLPRGAPFPRARPLCHGCVRSLTVPQFTRTFHTPVSWPSCCLEHHASPFCLAPSPCRSPKPSLKVPLSEASSGCPHHRGHLRYSRTSVVVTVSSLVPPFPTSLGARQDPGQCLIHLSVPRVQTMPRK